MADQGFADLADTRIGRVADALEHRLRDGELVEVSHDCLLPFVNPDR
jgi:hypothetical protein